MQTDFDHGGGQLYIITAELGYGGNGIARMNGGTLKKINEETIIGRNSQVVGFYKTWDASSYEDGQFTYENTSIVSPWNTLKTSFFIK